MSQIYDNMKKHAFENPEELEMIYLRLMNDHGTYAHPTDHEYEKEAICKLLVMHKTDLILLERLRNLIKEEKYIHEKLKR